MEHLRLPDARLAVSGRRLPCTTELAYFGAYQLTIWTVVPELAVELHSSYLGHPDGESAVAHLQLQAGEGPTTVTEVRPGSTLPVREHRRLCLYNHLAALRQLVTDGARQTMSAARTDRRSAAGSQSGSRRARCATTRSPATEPAPDGVKRDAQLGVAERGARGQ